MLLKVSKALSCFIVREVYWLGLYVPQTMENIVQICIWQFKNSLYNTERIIANVILNMWRFFYMLSYVWIYWANRNCISPWNPILTYWSYKTTNNNKLCLWHWYFIDKLFKVYYYCYCDMFHGLLKLGFESRFLCDPEDAGFSKN